MDALRRKIRNFKIDRIAERSSSEFKRFTNKNLHGINLKGANLRGFSFLRSNLSGKDLSYAIINYTRFISANLERAIFANNIAERVDFTEANLNNAQFINVNLRESNFEKAKLESAIFTNVNFKNNKFENSNLNNAILNGEFIHINFKKCDLKNSIMNGADFYYCFFNNSNLEYAELEGANLQNSDFNSAILNNTRLKDANLKQVRFVNTNLQGADLRFANLEEADLTGAILDGVIIEETNIEGTIMSQENFDNFFANSNYQGIPVIIGSSQSRENFFLRRNRGIRQPTSQTIVIPKNAINGKNNGTNNSNKCKNYTELFNIINSKDLKMKPRFVFEGQGGIDAGGLTRIVFDKYLTEFKRKYFTGDKFEILKNMTQNNKSNFEHSLGQLKKLRTYASQTRTGQALKMKIFININSLLMRLLQAPNPINLFTRANVNKYLRKNNQNLTSKEYLNSIYVDFGDLILQNNKEKKIENWRNDFNDAQIKEILFRYFLKEQGFESIKQFNDMRDFISKNWDDNFSNFIDYSWPAFSQRVVIIDREKEEKPYLLSEGSKNMNKIISSNPNLQLLIQFIRESEENRRDFSKLVNGSEFYDGLMKIFVNKQYFQRGQVFRLYDAHTCFNYINLYPTPPDNKWNMDSIGQQIKLDIQDVHN